MTYGTHVYVLYGLLVGLAFALWRSGRRIDAIEDAMERERDVQRLERSRSGK